MHNMCCTRVDGLYGNYITVVAGQPLTATRDASPLRPGFPGILQQYSPVKFFSNRANR